MSKEYSIHRQPIKEKTVREQYLYFQKKLLKKKLEELEIDWENKHTTRERIDNLLKFNKKFDLRGMNWRIGKKGMALYKGKNKLFKISNKIPKEGGNPFNGEGRK